jgi:IS30 family transposase
MTVVQALRKLQEEGVLNYGRNVLTITPDNGSEFWMPKEMSQSIHNRKDDINIYFCNPYHS